MALFRLNRVCFPFCPSLSSVHFSSSSDSWCLSLLFLSPGSVSAAPQPPLSVARVARPPPAAASLSLARGLSPAGRAARAVAPGPKPAPAPWCRPPPLPLPLPPRPGPRALPLRRPPSRAGGGGAVTRRGGGGKGEPTLRLLPRLPGSGLCAGGGRRGRVGAAASEGEAGAPRGRPAQPSPARPAQPCGRARPLRRIHVRVRTGAGARWAGGRGRPARGSARARLGGVRGATGAEAGDRKSVV